MLARHPELRAGEAVRELERAVLECAARDPRRALALADLAVLGARRLDEDLALVARMARARALFRCSRYREADALYLDVATAREARGERHEAGLAHLARLGPLTNLGELDEALAATARAGIALRRSGNALDRAKLTGNRAMVLHRMGRLKEALTCNVHARRTFAAAGERLNVAILDLNRAQIHSQRGQAGRARALLAGARRTFESLGQTVLVASVDYNRACDDVTSGRYDRAWRGLEAVRGVFAELGDADAVARADLDLAEIAWRLGSPEVARESAARAREGFERLGARIDAARARCVEALTLARTGAVAAAREALGAAAATFEAEGHPIGAGRAALDLATLLVPDDPTRAAALAHRSGAILRRAGLRDASLRALLVESLAHARRGSPRAGALLRRVASAAGRRGLPDVAWHALSALAGLHLAAGRTVTARRLLDRAVDGIDRMRNDLRRLEPARWVLRDGAPVYEQAIGAWLCAQADARCSERAFIHAERARSRALADELALAAGQVHEPLTLQRRLDVREDGSLPQRRARAPARGAFGGWSSLTGSEEAGAAARGEALRASLDPHEALLEYQRVGDTLWAFVVTRDGVAARDLGTCAAEADDLLARLDFHFGKFALGPAHARRFMPGLRRRADALLERLGRLLLRPVEDSLRGGRLIVVPTRELHGAPFAALRLDGRYLVESVATSLAPSCLVLALLRRRRRRGRGALVVGVGSAALPQVHREARDVAALLPGSRLLVGEAADRTSFHEGVRGRAIVHVATHGAFRPDRPTLSSLLLADGPLTLSDVATLPLCADLVTLTACDSGRSQVGPGDDLTGLARGFLHAGARSVLVSLWGLDDAHSRRVMRAFYRGLRAAPGRGATAEALRAAVAGVSRTAPHPFYWATFALVGAP